MKKFQVKFLGERQEGHIRSDDLLSALVDALAGQVVLEGHIKHCVRDGIEHGDADKTIESFTKAVERFANMK